MTKARDLANASTALSAVSATELAFVDGVTSAIQTQMDAKLATATAATTYVANTGNYAAGKNKIINGNFSINQRSFTTTSTNGTYGFDRFSANLIDGTVSYSAETFTTGAAPVAGYESANFARLTSTGQTAANSQLSIRQPIEDVRTFAGETVTISFWAKAASGTPKVAIEFIQAFGSGGSPSTAVLNYAGQITLSTSWVRYSVTTAIPSISGKTIGTTANTSQLIPVLWCSSGSDTASRTGSLGIQSNTFDLWGVQVEAGSVATAFQTATGTIQGELAACQRYYYLLASGTGQAIANGFYVSATQYSSVVPLPVTMRSTPTLSVVTGSNYYATWNGASDLLDSLTILLAGTKVSGLTNTTEAAGTAYRPAYLETNNAASFVAYSAEL